MATGELAAGGRGRPPTRAAAVAHAPSRRGLFTWQGQIALLMLVIWWIPIKLYTLPIPLPFNLEVYRLAILFMLVAFVMAWVSGTISLDAQGNGKAAALLALGGLLALVANSRAISQAGVQSESIKQLSYVLSFLVVFLLIVSTIRTMQQLDVVVVALVFGAAVVAALAIYESRSNNNIFSHLNRYVPFLDIERDANTNIRRGQLRVRGSAQHPIALGAALTMMAPLAMYLASRARTALRAWFWRVSGLLLAAAALATISRTVVLMLIGMAICALWLRRRQVVRYWPLLIVLPIAAQLAAPGSVRGIYKAFFPQQGLVTQQDNARVGGSGRVADLEPGIKIWLASPIWGHGLGTEFEALAGSEGRVERGKDLTANESLVFDDQYMNTLVTLGLMGLVGLVWFIWGGVLRVGRVARAYAGRASDLCAACAIASAGFATGLLTYDAFAFVQVTLLFFIVTALGLSARRLLVTPG